MDPVANFLTSIRNGYLARKSHVQVPMTKFNQALAQSLAHEGYLGSIKPQTNEETNRTALNLELRYTAGIPAVARIRRISTPGRRLYATHRQIPSPRTGIGTLIVSTSVGLLTGRRARKDQIGGELICEIIRGGSQ